MGNICYDKHTSVYYASKSQDQYILEFAGWTKCCRAEERIGLFALKEVK